MSRVPFWYSAFAIMDIFKKQKQEIINDDKK